MANPNTPKRAPFKGKPALIVTDIQAGLFADKPYGTGMPGTRTTKETHSNDLIDFRRERDGHAASLNVMKYLQTGARQ